MAKKKLSDEQKIRNKIRQNVISKRNFLDKDSNRAIKDQFVEKFVLCEIALKSVLSVKVPGRPLFVEIYNKIEMK